MRGTVLVSAALFAVLAGMASAASAQLPRGRGVLLPLQDRVGTAEVADAAEALLRRELEAHADLADPTVVRAVLRSMRVRDASTEPLDRLNALAERLGVNWFFLATLHEAIAGRELRRQDDGSLSSQRFEDSSDTPQVVLSARILLDNSPEIWWAGFDGASGRDDVRAFGLGEVESLELLMEDTVSGLVARAVESPESSARSRLRTPKHGYQRSANGPSAPQTVAVIPMDSIASVDPSGSAEVATAALFATLDDFGFTALVPGFVQAIRYENGEAQYGAASQSDWEALASEGGARWVATGTVETYRRGLGRTPDPRVAFSLRFLDASDGSIDWSDGLDHSGKESASAFDRGRIYSTGGLTHEMMRALFVGLRKGSAAGRATWRK